MDQRSLFCALLLAFYGTAFGQATPRVNKPFDKEHFADVEKLKAAQAALKKGDAYFEDGGTLFTQALEQYEIAHAVNPDNAELNLKMGLCHLNGRFHHRCLPYFQAAYELDNSTRRIHFLLGMGYHLNAEWDKAITEYDLHKASVSRMPDPEPLYNTSDRRIAECRNGKALQAKPVNGQVSNLGPAINSEVADYGVLVNADGSRMMFTSRRSNTTGGKINKATSEYFEDIYACTRTDRGWTEPLPLPEPANTSINDASVGLYNDGRTMIIYRDDNGMGDLYESTREGDTWSEPKSMGEAINSPANETSAWFSFDRKQLYFVSDRDGGLGGQDIWVSQWDGVAETWGEPRNLGPSVNTYEDEDGVFVHPDGTTLYFSSKGYDCMGGFDVFKTTLVESKWSHPVNLGWPVNSPDDDLFFVLNASGTSGYFSSVRPNGLGEDDIYRVDFLPDAKAQETASAGGAGSIAPVGGMNTVMLSGRIFDFEALAGLEAVVELLDLSDGHLVATFHSDAKTGEYLAVLPSGKNYAMHVRAKGYMLHSENVSTATEAGAVKVDMNISLQPLESGMHEALRNIFFESDQAILNPSSLAELGQLLKMLRENPKLRVEIGGHTDASGSQDHNEQLSKARAQAVVDHLVNNGIPVDRLEAKGYGATQPVAPNDSSENKAKNRRTEMRVL